MRRNRTQYMDPIKRGTTPTLKFNHPYGPGILDLVECGYITFVQRGEVVFEKRFDDDSVQVAPQCILVDLNREETLQLTTADLCRAQILFDLKYGKVAESGIYKIPVHESLKGGEIR